jgi:hypothetical protein
MQLPLDTIVQHHEGFGKPRNGVYLPHYSYILGLDEWHIRSDLNTPVAAKPGGDTSVIDFNRVVIGVCLTGNRQTGIPDNPAYPVTDVDIEMMVEVGIDARRRGWLIDNPHVRDHNSMPGSRTVCSGDLTRARWDDVYNAYQLTIPVGDDVPKDKDFVASFANASGSWKMQYDGGIETISGTFFGSYFTLPPADRNDPNRRFLTGYAHPTSGYSIVSLKGEVYDLIKPGG